MNEEIKAASVDSPEFRELMSRYEGANGLDRIEACTALIAHINAWSDERCNQLAASRAMLPVTDWKIDGGLIYRLNDEGVNCDEINVTMANGSRSNESRNAAAQSILAALASPVAGWVSVEERLPPDDSLVMVYVPDSQYAKVRFDTWQMQREAPVSFSSETVEIGFGWDEHEFEEITHWMPFPPAPSPLQEQS